MIKFPDAVITAMHHADTTVTCLPVRLEDDNVDAWESAVFFVVPANIDDTDLKELFPAKKLFPVELEADVREHDNGTLIELGISIDLGLENIMEGLVLFLTGHISSHYESVQLLSRQESLGIFIGDAHCNLLHQQRIPLAAQHRRVFNDMLQEVVKRDALIRMAGKYDPEKVFSSATDNF